MAHHDTKHTVEALEYLRTKLPTELQSPSIGIICGSGLGGMVDAVMEQPQVSVSYSDIPHCAKSTGEHSRLSGYYTYYIDTN